MSRVHDALRRAERGGELQPPSPAGESAVVRQGGGELVTAGSGVVLAPEFPPLELDFDRIPEFPFTPAADSILVDPSNPNEAPTEEFRSLRTRLNHLQTLQPVHSVVITSPSPAEGKSFATVNLALAEAQLEGNRTIVCDCDFRRPVVHNYFQIPRTPGMTDYLLGKAPLQDCVRKLSGTNLYVLPAGEAVINPLELLNLDRMKQIVEELPRFFNWVIFDSPPLLFAADASLLSTLCHGTIIVVRIGTTTIDSVTRAMQSLCNNNVLGTIVNGASRGELYSKYAYYRSYYYPKLEA